MNKKATVWKIVLNTIFSLALIATSIICWFFVDRAWEIFLYLTLWSCFSIMVYIVCFTIYDYTEYFQKQNEIITNMNYFIRNHYVRICIPYSLAVVLLFWTLVIMGDEFFKFGGGVKVLRSCYLHGVICIFACIDLFISEHVYFKHYGWDILIITIVYICYLVVIGCGKYIIGIDAYAFMENANVRQCIGAALVIYMIILGSYALFMFVTYLIYGDKKPIVSEDKKVNNESNSKENIKGKEEVEMIGTGTNELININNNRNMGNEYQVQRESPEVCNN